MMTLRDRLKEKATGSIRRWGMLDEELNTAGFWALTYRFDRSLPCRTALL